ncbi:MAG: hypothetical protein GX613_07990 [Chloroflexi bacterium]|nr:hypothetical protein [Chloroflexota bacterium]
MAQPVIEQVAEIPYKQFVQRVEGKRIVLIYPRHRGRGALLAMCLRHYGTNAIFYSLTESENTLEAWLRRMVDAPAFPESFGAQTREALKKRAKPEDLAAALGADLGSVRSKSYGLILDAFDTIQPTKAVERFVSALPAALPDKVQVVINARLLRLQPWNDLVLAGDAVVVGAEEAIDGGIYGDEEQRGQLEVFALSGGHVYANGRPVTSWDGSLPRHLFYYFVDHPMVTRDQIFEVFWPKMSVKEATNVFHVTKRKISERLGFELTQYSSGFYLPSPKIEIHYDVRVFEDAVHEAMENEESAPANWSLAVQMYRAHFLPAIRTPWVEARRDELQNKYAQALIGLGRYHRREGELALAQGYLLRALREKPDWEDVHRDVMNIYREQGRRDDAAAQYRQLERTLDSMFGIQPSRETRELYETIAAG